MIEHTPEFIGTPAARAAAREQGRVLRDLARDYAQVFLGTEAGRRVWADLRKKFGLTRLCFGSTPKGRVEPLAAALVDGERRVMLEIQNAVSAGAPEAGLLDEFRKTLA
jgi:hypothetical protein